MDAKQVNELLIGRSEEVCRMLLPGGRNERGEWTCGDLQGTKGNSLKVTLHGPAAGRWKDFDTKSGSPGGGSFLNLWMHVRNISFVEALREAKRWLGLPDDGPPGSALKRWEHPQTKLPPARPVATGRRDLQYERIKRDSKVWNWLTGRGLKAETIEAYKVGEAHFSVGGKERDFVIFPFWDAQGNLVRIKFRDIEDKACQFQKPNKEEAGQFKHGYQKLLFGWQALKENDFSVAITEGEIDAMTLHGSGQPALSLPEGAQPVTARKDATPDQAQEALSESHKAWMDHDMAALDRFLSVIIATDMDEPGRKAAAAILPRLGMARSFMLTFPTAKDSNEAAEKGELAEALKNLSECRPADLKRPSEFAEDIWDEFFPEEKPERLGHETAWAMPFRFLPGQLTIWHGYNGSGKTICMTYSMVKLAAKYGVQCCVASLEMPARKTFKNAMRQAMGSAHPWGNKDEQRREVFRTALAWADQHFLVYDKLGEIGVDDIIGVFDFAFRRYGVQHFVVDSLMMLRGQGATDSELWSAQRDVAKALKDFATANGVHVHLVAHSKKPDAKKDPRKGWPSKFDISGSGNLSNLADNVVCVWRHEMKENMLRDAGFQLSLRHVQQNKDDKLKWEKQIRDWAPREDSMFVVQKQRETGEMPAKRLYFDFGQYGTWQYVEEPDKSGVRCMIPELERSWPGRAQSTPAAPTGGWSVEDTGDETVGEEEE